MAARIYGCYHSGILLVAWLSRMPYPRQLMVWPTPQQASVCSITCRGFAGRKSDGTTRIDSQQRFTSPRRPCCRSTWRHCKPPSSRTDRVSSKHISTLFMPVLLNFSPNSFYNLLSLFIVPLSLRTPFATMLFALLSAFLLSALAQANWLGNGQAEWSSRCALGSEMDGDYVCFTSPSDITQKGASGTWAGYAASDGKGNLHPPHHFPYIC